MLLGRQSASGPLAYAEALALRLAAGEPLPADIIERAHDAVVHDAKAAAADVVCRSLSVHVTATFDQVAEESAPALLAGLAGQLVDLITATTAAGVALAGHDVTDPAALVGARADCRAAYQELGRLAEEYDGLRVAQRATERSDDQADYQLSARLGLVDLRDALEMWDWREAERDRHARLPWPSDPRAKLLLIASRRPWVATLAQMQAVRTAALSGQVAA